MVLAFEHDIDALEPERQRAGRVASARESG
jgi:hypothetical protein